MSDISINSKLKLRSDSSVNWSVANPTLLLGEAGFETDTNKLKIGDGTTRWNNLEYFGGGSGAQVYCGPTAPDDPEILVWIDTTGSDYDVFENSANKVTTISSASTDVQYPSAKAVYTQLSALSSTINTLSSTVQSKAPIANPTFTGTVTAPTNTSYTTRQVRNVILSTQEPTNSQGSNGDVWIQYEG